MVERIITQVPETDWERYRCEGCAVGESISTDSTDVVGEVDCLEATAVEECVIIDSGYILRERYFFQFSETCEC